MWPRYCSGVSALVFVLDSTDLASLPAAKTELFGLLEKEALAGIPLLVLGNTCDLPGALSADELYAQLDLKEMTGREVACYAISASGGTNVELTLRWLLKQAGNTRPSGV
jgi:ADP-ribosylation factor-like protein 8